MADNKEEDVKAAGEGEEQPEGQGAEAAVAEEAAEFEMADDECYPDDYVEKPFVDSQLSRRSMRFYECLGQTSFKRYNFHHLGDQDFIFTTGNTYQIYNMGTNKRTIYHGTDTDGVGSIAVHPTKKWFAVAEKGKSPNVYIYEWPSLKLYRILRKGTEMSYAHVEFATSGELLASLGGAPDYTLTVWEWRKQRVILKNRAFGGEVFRVSFSPYTDNILFSCGFTHVKFWKMAETFTGLKLQGELAKYGKLELSHVSCFHELIDGKVVSGTTYGTMIVWEGELIKSHLMLEVEPHKPLHNGWLEVIIQDGDYFLTAGADGWIKWWRISEIDSAEAEEGVDYAIAPVREILIAKNEQTGEDPAYIINMTLANNKWYIQDLNGGIYVMDHDSDGVYRNVYNFHKGAIVDLCCSPSHNYAMSLGEDGLVKVWDYAKKDQMDCYDQKYYDGEGTCLTHMPHTDANKGRLCAIGFSNGIVRMVSVTADHLSLLKAFKAHDEPIIAMRFSRDLRLLVTASTKGNVFFFDLDPHSDIQKFEPLCTVKLPDEAEILDFKWDPEDQSLFFGCKNGRVYELQRPNPKKIDNSDTYYWHDAQMKMWEIKLMESQMEKNQKKDEAEEEKKRRMRLRGELPPEDEEPEEVWDPQPIRTILPYKNEVGKTEFIVSSEGKFNGLLYVCQMDEERPLRGIEIKDDTLVTRMEIHETDKPGEQLLTICYDDGDVELIIDQNWDKRMSIKYHDAHTGQVTSAQFSNKQCNFFLTAGRDGLIYVHQFDKTCAVEESKLDPLANVEGANFLPAREKEEERVKQLKKYADEHQAVFPPIDDDVLLDEASLAISLKLTEPTEVDADPTAYSIQQSKLRTEEDHRMSLAEKKKEKVRAQIRGLRDEFAKVVKKSTRADEHLQISEDDFQIDPEFFQILYERNESKIEETKKEVAWGIEYATVNLNKLKNKYYDVLEFEKFTVKGIKNGAYVTTFRVQKMSDFLTARIEAFKAMLENEMIGKNQDDDDDFLDDASKDGDNAVDDTKQKEKEKAAALAAKQKAAQQAALNAKKTEAEKKREVRKLEREKKKRQIEQLEKKEAMHSNEDAEDRKEIEIARQTYGDYKLKTQEGYQVPENQRINYSKKHQQMVLLEGSIHKLKVDFNQKIQELKIRKKEIVDHVTNLNVRLTEINIKLGTTEELFAPEIDLDTEYPENYFEIKEDDLTLFKKQKEEEAKKAKKGGAAAKSPSKKDKSKKEEDDANEEEDQDGEEAIKTERSVEVLEKRCIARKNAKVQSTDQDQEYNQIQQIELIYEKEQKKKEADDLIKAFDDECKEMQKEKYRLESDLKNAEMKLILYNEELIFLESMEDKDVSLTRRLAACRQDKGQILKEINEISRKLKDKKKEIDDIKDREEGLMEKFHELCPERSDKYEEIRKFFEKIIKRRRKFEPKEKAEGDDDEDDDDVDEEEEVEEEEDEDEDENTIAGLPPEEYKIEDIEKLREERLDLYEEKEKILSFINELETQRKRLETKERNIKTDLEETEDEIQEFQSEKMSKLNQLQVSIVLKVKQIQNLAPHSDQSVMEKWQQIKEEEVQRRIDEFQQRVTNEGIDDMAYIEQEKEKIISEDDWRGYFMPADLKNSVIFTRTQLLQLINRKRVLEEEQFGLQKAFREFRREFTQQRREIKENEKKRAAAEREYNERQMLRFGNLVDLDNLEVSGPSGVVIELQQKFAKTEKRCIKMIEEADAQFEATQRELTASMKSNTMLLNMIRDLGEKELDLDKKLNDSNKAIFVDEDDEKKRVILQEKLKIKKLLEIQAKEIETFKTEINMYKRKGGHIYTKVTTNRRVALNQDN